MIDENELTRLAEECRYPAVTVVLKPMFGEMVLELLGERKKLLEVLKKSRIFCEHYEGWGGSFNELDEATDACSTIKTEEAGE